MFNLSKHKTSIKTEIMAGIITFLTMAYIIVVNPVILGDAGVPFEQAFTATIIAAVVGTLFMAIFTNLPIAIAPGMGLNAYFSYSVVKAHEGMTFAIAFSAVFVAGMILILLSFTSFRTKLMEAIPENLKHAITAGIGLFIAFIGLRLTGIVTKNDANLVGLGDLHSAPAYIESSAGVAAGGRTGLTTVTVAVLFALAAFFGPLVSAVSGVSAITAPSLIIVGSLMMGSVRHIDWDTFDEAFPAFLVILSMPLTSSIATGIALGFISYPLMKVAKGKFRAVHPLVYVFGILFAYQLIFLPH